MSRLKCAVVLALVGSLGACSESTPRDTERDPAGSGDNAGNASSGTDDDADAAATGGGANAGASGNTEGGGTEGTGTTDGGTTPVPGGSAPTLPMATGTCPTFKAGMLSFSAGGTARNAQIWVDEKAAKDKDGPVVFYWHGTGSSPMEAQYGLGQAGIKTITDLGGIVVGAVAINSGMFPWLTETDSTFKLVDEIVACAEKEIGIDDRQIHSVGMSAGGLFTSTLSFARSNILASIAVYSGGGMGTFADPKNKFPALVYFGGPTDNVFGFDFQNSTQQYVKVLRDAGHLAIQCDHGQGHNLPVSDAPTVVPFFLAHPYGVQPAAYASAFPAGFPSYCKKS